jgi:hypothetical protein
MSRIFDENGVYEMKSQEGAQTLYKFIYWGDKITNMELYLLYRGYVAVIREAVSIPPYCSLSEFSREE